MVIGDNIAKITVYNQKLILKTKTVVAKKLNGFNPLFIFYNVTSFYFHSLSNACFIFVCV